MSTRIRIDGQRCSRCGTCALTCTENIFTQAGRDALPALNHPDLCIACGHCVAMCPRDAIEHADCPPGSVTPVRAGLAPSPDQVLEMIRMRRSVRLFQERPVPREVVERVLEAARLAPSAHNFQSTQYVVVQDPAMLRFLTETCGRYYAKVAGQLRNPAIKMLYRLALSKQEVESAAHLVTDMEMVAALAANGEDPFLHHAPCVLVAHAEKSLNFPESNAILALHNATFMAQALGLASFLIGYLAGACQRDKTIPRRLDIPPGHAVFGALALGYPRMAYTRWPGRKPLRVRWM